MHRSLYGVHTACQKGKKHIRLFGRIIPRKRKGKQRNLEYLGKVTGEDEDSIIVPPTYKRSIKIINKRGIEILAPIFRDLPPTVINRHGPFEVHHFEFGDHAEIGHGTGPSIHMQANAEVHIKGYDMLPGPEAISLFDGKEKNIKSIFKGNSIQSQ